MNTSFAGFLSLTRKETKRVFRIWKQTLIPPVITTTLYFLIFWSFIGSRIGTVGEVSYINFLIPGFIMMSLITSSYSNVASSFFGAKFQRHIEEILTSPIKNYAVILWFLSGWILRGMLVWIIVFEVAQFFSDVPLVHPFLAFVFLFFTASLMSLAGFFNAFFAKDFDGVNFIPTFVITPMVYLAWVFYPIASLTGIWYTLSQFNPIYYMVDGLRYSFLWFGENMPLYSLGCIILANIVLFLICLYMFQRWYGLKS